MLAATIGSRRAAAAMRAAAASISAAKPTLQPVLATVALACVAAVPGFGLDGLEARSAGGAVGLVVPDAGPTTSETRARAALATGQVVNSLRGDLPSGPHRIR